LIDLTKSSFLHNPAEFTIVKGFLERQWLIKKSTCKVSVLFQILLLSFPPYLPSIFAVVEAAGLHTQGRSNTAPNTYVRIHVGDFNVRTKLIKQTSNPSWNEEFKL